MFRLFLALLLSIAAPHAYAFDTAAEQAILVDLATDTILLEKNADTQMPPSSMSKLMTVYVTFQLLKEGSIEMDTPVTASPEVWRKWRLKGSTMFLNANQSVTVGELLQGIIVQSGNDACAWLAEAVAGSEDAFVSLMNQAGEQIGLTDSNFMNVNGWPDPEQYMTPRDLYRLARALIEDFPEYYDMFAQRRFEFGPAESNYNNRNPILGRVRGADGLKTGHTEDAGYGLTGSAVRDDRRLVVVVNGLTSDSARRSESARLLEWGFSNFRVYDLLEAGDVLASAPVWMGEKGSVNLAVAEDVSITLSRQDRANMTAVLKYETPLPAPVESGAQVATLELSVADGQTLEIPVVATESIAPVSGIAKIGAAFDYLVFGGVTKAQ